MKRKLSSLALALVLTVSMGVTAFASECSKSDDGRHHWKYTGGSYPGETYLGTHKVLDHYRYEPQEDKDGNFEMKKIAVYENCRQTKYTYSEKKKCTECGRSESNVIETETVHSHPSCPHNN